MCWDATKDSTITSRSPPRNVHRADPDTAVVLLRPIAQMLIQRLDLRPVVDDQPAGPDFEALGLGPSRSVPASGAGGLPPPSSSVPVSSRSAPGRHT